jgi:thiosulfate dehydrogenase [quinone] large subunit
MPPAPLPTPAADRRIGLLMLPLRLFLGATFVYAGLVKLLDPTFLDPSSPTSIVAQLQGFERASPLAPLIGLIGVPFAVPIGLSMALAEIAIGLGALTGIAARLVAVGGFGVSILFWLTASWSTTPYFYGPDLPYAAGWLTLALIGDGGILVLRDRLARWAGVAGRPPSETRRRPYRPPMPLPLAATTGPGLRTRRWLLESGVLAAAAIVIGGLGTALRRHADPPATALGLGADGQPTPRPTAATPPPTRVPTTPGPTPAATPDGGSVLASISDLKAAGSVEFVDPFTGDPGVLIRQPNGKIVAFDAVCTHAGCTVQYVEAYDALVCPCHGAAFDARDGRVLAGPTNTPLTKLPIHVDGQTGAISITA